MTVHCDQKIIFSEGATPKPILCLTRLQRISEQATKEQRKIERASERTTTSGAIKQVVE